MSKGLIIAIEGLDGSGKATQSKKLLERLEKEGKKVILFDFPQYEHKSSWLVREYLSGNIAKDYKAVDPRSASSFYAVDRKLAFEERIRPYYEEGYIIIFDRWTTANILHQSMKAEKKEEIDKVIDWIYELEYNVFELPEPDITFLLKVPPEYSFELLKTKVKNDGSIKQDIHESNIEFLKRSYENGIYVSNKLGWHVIECYDNGMKNVEDIHSKVYEEVKNMI